MWSRLEMIILDYDLSSVVNYVDFYEAFCRALREVREDGNYVSFNDFQQLLDSDMLRERIQQITDESFFWRKFRQLYISRHSFPRRGLKEFLLSMKHLAIKVVVISGRETRSEYIWWDLRRHGLDELIDDVVTMYDLNLLPLREEFLFDKSPLIEYVKKKHGVLGNFICIGDYVADYYSCDKSGGVFIGIGNEARTSVLKKAGVKLVASDFYEVLLILRELGLLGK